MYSVYTTGAQDYWLVQLICVCINIKLTRKVVINKLYLIKRFGTCVFVPTKTKTTFFRVSGVLITVNMNNINMYNEQNCLQFDALSFLSFVPVTTEHAKALYKLRLVLVNAKGSNITSLELPRHREITVGEMFATNSFK